MDESIKIEPFDMGPKWEQKSPTRLPKKKRVYKSKHRGPTNGKRGIHRKNNNAYIRDSVYDIDDVLPYVHGGPDCEHPYIREYNGREVRMGTKKYRFFKEKGIECVECKIKGAFFALERQKNQKFAMGKGEHIHQENKPHDIYHFNLYAYGPNREEILMTMDHIMPKCKGGTNAITNLQVMCEFCNHAKDDKVIRGKE